MIFYIGQNVSIYTCLILVLAPPAGRPRSFSNANSSVVVSCTSSVVNFSLKLPDNFSSFLAWSFLRKVLMHCKMWIWLNLPKGYI